MKHPFFLFFILLSIAAFSQVQPDSTQQSDKSVTEPVDRTFLDEPVHHAVHGALLLKLSRFGPHQDNSLLIGGDIAWVLNKKYLLGFGITGLSTPVKAPHMFPVDGLDLVSNYGGFIVGYIHNSRNLVHMEAQTLFGIGQAFYRDSDYSAAYDQNDAFVVVEPAVNAVLNVTSGFRLSAGLSYRAIANIDLIGLTTSDVSGISLNIGFKVGRF